MITEPRVILFGWKCRVLLPIRPPESRCLEQRRSISAFEVGHIFLAQFLFGFNDRSIWAKNEPVYQPSKRSGMSAQYLPSEATNPMSGTTGQPFKGALSALFANDYFAGNDNRYTSGLGLFWTSPISMVLAQTISTQKSASFFLYSNGVKARLRDISAILPGHENIYGQRHYRSRSAPHDHPYAGNSLLGQFNHIRRCRSSHQFSLRMVGWARIGGQERSNPVSRHHRLPGAKGWDTQLKNEPINAINLRTAVNQ